MAMLAEPRRKQKFGSDPRNTFWSNDDSKFGQRMLERMGWSKGKGLGSSESGRTEHITTSFRQRDDTRGVGCSKNHADNWLAHQDDFNSLLESLNSDQDTATAQSTKDSTPKGVASLEEKSKSSRSRVHYHKFTRGKDLSSRSAEDLNCIFGKRVKEHACESNTPVSQSEANSDEDSNKDSASSPAPESENTSSKNRNNNATSDDVFTHGIKTITSCSNIQEYFAQKMAELKRRQTGASSSPRDGDEGSSGADGHHGQEEGGGHSSADADSSQWKRKEKKKRKLEKESDEHDQQWSVDSVSVEEEKLLLCDDRGELRLESEKIKKKNKKQNAGENERQKEFATELVENATDEKADKKKKKHKKEKRKSAKCDGDSKAEKDVQMALDKDSATEGESAEQESCTKVADDTSNKKKSRKRKSNKSGDTDADGAVQVADGAVHTVSGAGVAEEPSSRSEHTQIGDVPSKKSKKKKSKATDEKEEVNKSDVVPKRKKSVRFSLGGDYLFVPGVEEGVTSSSVQSGTGAEFEGKTTKKRKKESSDTVDRKKSKMDEVESKNGNTTQASSHRSESVSVQSDVSSSLGAISSQTKKKKRGEKNKKPARAVDECFSGSNLAHVKGYGNL